MDYYSADNEGGGGEESQKEEGRVGREEKEKAHHDLCLRSHLNKNTMEWQCL